MKKKTEDMMRANGCVKFNEIGSNAMQIGIVRPGEYEEQEVWWDTETGNIYVEIRNHMYEESLDSFGFKHGRYLDWMSYVGNCTGERMNAEDEMQRLIENAELL